ncbi:hypothetical protein COS75_02505 [Candidatus Pacearchaeota archaeon CG06_land_8_20_14_3_00_35_12]|nr:MAG: hypothetical protein COS75_02505 [Candidatus Pacearchaeota archaeon CG06_land_8_20_14_3_00_35_12]
MVKTEKGFGDYLAQVLNSVKKPLYVAGVVGGVVAALASYAGAANFDYNSKSFSHSNKKTATNSVQVQIQGKKFWINPKQLGADLDGDSSTRIVYANGFYVVMADINGDGYASDSEAVAKESSLDTGDARNMKKFFKENPDTLNRVYLEGKILSSEPIDAAALSIPTKKETETLLALAKGIPARETKSLEQIAENNTNALQETPNLRVSYRDLIGIYGDSIAYGDTQNLANALKEAEIDSQINKLKSREITWLDYLFWGAKPKLELQLNEAKTDGETELAKYRLSSVTVDSNMVRGVTAFFLWGAYELIRGLSTPQPSGNGGRGGGPGFGGGDGEGGPGGQ